MDDQFICAYVSLIAIAYLYSKRKRRRRRYKVRPINAPRSTLGFYKVGFLAMKMRDTQQFFKYTRMSTTVFRKFYRLVALHLRAGRILPDGVSPEEKLAVTLHYLSQGSSMQTCAWKYKLGLTTVHKLIKETCEVIWEVLSPIYLRTPSSPNEWKSVADEFYRLWNFPNCLGALDGKHVSIQAPPNSGSQYFNYKKDFSVVLLATADASYKFLMVDIGAYGSQSDGGIFADSIFGQAMDNNAMNIPAPSNLPGHNVKVPHVLVADEAFPLKHYIMRPYPGRHLSQSQRIFNYRLSRARRIIENTFGILVARWRILRNTIIADVNTIDSIIKATVCLHNFVQTENHAQYCPPGYVDHDDGASGQWRRETDPLPSIGRVAANVAKRAVYQQRDTVKDYFMTPQGEVPWQYARVEEGGEMEDIYVNE